MYGMKSIFPISFRLYKDFTHTRELHEFHDARVSNVKEGYK